MNKEEKQEPKKVSKFWEACQKFKGAFIVYDPAFSLQCMRYLLDTNIFVYSAIDTDSLSSDVRAILEDYDNTFCISAESVKELIVAYRTKGLGVRFWKTPEAMVRAIENDYGVTILPLAKEHMLTYSRLEINEAQGHKDPSDHIIISQAITEHLPLISSDLRFPFYCAQGLELIYNHK